MNSPSVRTLKKFDTGFEFASPFRTHSSLFGWEFGTPKARCEIDRDPKSGCVAQFPQKNHNSRLTIGCGAVFFWSRLTRGFTSRKAAEVRLRNFLGLQIGLNFVPA